jgi:putative exosortase-associated protein (TIGR04073 family)
MKSRFLFTLVAVLTIAGIAMADIQSPPGHVWGWSRKLARALANIAYSPSEIIHRWDRGIHQDGNTAAGPLAAVEGTKRCLVRVGYGIFELVTFPAPTYKKTYRPPFYKKERIDPYYGYDEFPPQVGIISQAGYSRTQLW